MATPQELVDEAIYHQIKLEGLKLGTAKEFESFLKEIDKNLRERLAGKELTELSRTRVESQLRDVNNMMKQVYGDYTDELQGDLFDIAVHEAATEAAMLEGYAPSAVTFVLPAAAQIKSAMYTQPLSVRGADGGKLLEPFISDWTKAERDRVTGVIRQGFYEGMTNAEILREIRGTKANGFRDGTLETIRRHGEAIVRTAVQHVSSKARFEFWKANEEYIEGYRWESTIDNRTSQQCRSLDGRVFKVGHGPEPPIHINCRSTTVAELDDEYDWLKKGATRSSQDGYIDANESYYDWLRRQSKETQDDILGPTMGKVFRDGGVTNEQFAKMNLGKNFKPITIAEMREANPEAFRRASLINQT